MEETVECLARERQIDGWQSVLTERAYAKVNLTLEVLQKRSDGYHDLASIVQTVDLYDTLSFKLSDDLKLNCDHEGLLNGDNLVLRATKALMQATGVDNGAEIDLVKRVPIAAGVGGGSADAAAALRGLNRLWKLNLSADELVKIAQDVGADVPFLIEGGTALMLGTGDRLEHLPHPQLERLVVVVPQSRIVDEEQSGMSKTGLMFNALHPQAHTTGSLTRKLAARMNGGKDCHPAFMFNVFQQMAPMMYADWESSYSAFQDLGASDIILTGAGPSMFAFAPSKELGTAWAVLMKSRVNCDAYSVGLVQRKRL